MKIRHRSEKRRGVAAVELAVIAPLLVGLVLGAIELGRALEVSQMLSMAVREGGRRAATEFKGITSPDNETNEVIADIRKILNAQGIPADEATVEVLNETTGATANLNDPNMDGELFRINVSIPFSEVAYLTPVFLQGQNLNASIVMRAPD
ncbi:TadE-like protein [Planctomycetes bacterium Pan216]|uniref:TadE-like protein n=1 Tax=Kolteria novifilia TaxID=2527975 RepID=A0A518B2U6_9BACT|nr:TadE-like protein [Planctomycetes bacterium Pan216]